MSNTAHGRVRRQRHERNAAHAEDRRIPQHPIAVAPSFAQETRQELARIFPEKKCCQLAEISGFLRVAGSLQLAGPGRFHLFLSTGQPAVARHYKRLLQDYFAMETSLDIGEGATVGKARDSRDYDYRLTVRDPHLSERIMRETGLLLVREGRDYLSDGIYEGVVRNKCCKKAYLRGLFLGAGTMSDPEKSYHLEFVCRSEALATDLRRLIHTFVDLEAKVTQRGGRYVVYMKKADYIRDMLAIMGASGQVLRMEETRIKKDVVADARRIANCDTANVDRSVEAAMRQIDAINRIGETKGLSWLPDRLQEVAALRLAHPDLSIAALGELCDPPLKKSGINNRLRRIEELAAKLS